MKTIWWPLDIKPIWWLSNYQRENPFDDNWRENPSSDQQIRNPFDSHQIGKPFDDPGQIGIPFSLVWPVPLAQVWTHYKLGKLSMWTLFCNVCIYFWTAKYERKSCLNWMVSLQVLPRSWLIFPSKTWFLGIYWICTGKNHLKINISQILDPNLTK
jgi:hypothetical protein